MTVYQSGAPTSSPERDARRTHGMHGNKVKPSDMAVGVVIGRTAEAFDFLVYAIASVVVFPRLVFPYVDAPTGMLCSFAIFSLAFLARPLGTVLFTAIDRAGGRGLKLSVALMLLGTSTVAIAFLPGHAAIGMASAWFLAVFRVGQGLALGGSWDGLSSLLAVNAPPHRRGFYSMIPQLGAPFGAIVASALFAYLTAKLSPVDLLEWGWRYPFFVAFAINVVALFARLRIVVTPEYAKLFATQELQPSGILETVRSQGRTILIGAFVPLASFALFYLVTMFPLSWVVLFTPHTATRFLLIMAVGSACGVVATFASGWLADRLGPKTLVAATAGAIAAFGAFAPQLLNLGAVGEMMFVLSGSVLLGLSFGQAAGEVVPNFPMKYRYTGSALTADLAWLFGAGFTPWVVLAFASRFGLAFAGGFVLVGAVSTLIALFVNRQVTR